MRLIVWAGAIAAAAALVDAQAISPATVNESPTNAYFTPRPTFTPATTFAQPGDTHPTTVSGVGPPQNADPYTWNYTAPATTMQAPGNPSLSQSLISAGYGPSVSQLDPTPGALQVRCCADPDTRGAAQWRRIAAAVEHSGGGSRR